MHVSHDKIPTDFGENTAIEIIIKSKNGEYNNNNIILV